MSFFVCDEQNVILLFPSLNLKHSPSLAAPLYFIILPVAFHLLGHFKKQCIVNSLPEMRSNTYRALPTTRFITINVSSSLHPSHTFSGNVKCICNSHNTVMALRLRKVHYHIEYVFFFLLTALCCSAESLNQCNLNIHSIVLNEN